MRYRVLLLTVLCLNASCGTNKEDGTKENAPAKNEHQAPAPTSEEPKEIDKVPVKDPVLLEESPVEKPAEIATPSENAAVKAAHPAQEPARGVVPAEEATKADGIPAKQAPKLEPVTLAETQTGGEVLSDESPRASACPYTDGQKCFEHFVELTRAEDPDLKAAMVVLERSCELGSSPGCMFLGLHLADGWVFDVDVSRAQPLLEKTCEEGMVLACVRLGKLYYSKEATPKTGFTAESLFFWACDEASDAHGCLMVGQVLISKFMRDEDGEQRDENFNRARSYFEKSCELGDGDGCSEAGTAWTVDDRKRAKLFWKRGCEIGDDVGNRVCCDLYNGK